MQWKSGEKCWDLYPEGHLNNIGVRQKRSAHKINNFIDKAVAKEEGQGQARSMKSKTAATMIEGPKTFWEDQRAGGLKKRLQCQNLRIFLQFLLSTVRGRKLISRSWAGKEKIFRFGSFLPKKGPTLDPTFRYAVLFGPLDFLNWLPNLLKMENSINQTWCFVDVGWCWCM